MIHLNIEGKSWPEVTEQLAGLIRENGPMHTALATAEATISLLRDQLADATKEVALARKKCAKQAEEIAELKAMLASPAEDTPTENPTPAAEPAPETSEPADASETDTATEDAPAPATTTEQPKYDKVQVREFLAGCREKGVNITDVLKPFGGRFPAVKEEDYPALMEAAKKALADKEAK